MSENTSLAKIFVSATATQGGSPGAAVWLQHVTSFKDASSKSKEVTKAMGVKGGAGTKRKQGGGMITLTEDRQDSPQVDWMRWDEENKKFMLIVEDENQGVRTKYFGCEVSKVDMSGDDESSNTDEIEIVYKQRRRA